MFEKGSFLFPSLYMEANGKKIVGFIIEKSDDKVRIFLNNQNDTWIEKSTLINLFNQCKVL